MKKAFIILVIASALYSCKKSDYNTIKTNPVDTIPATVAISSNLNNTPAIKEDANYSYLGYGYDITGSYADASSVRAAAVDVKAYDLNNKYGHGVELSRATAFGPYVVQASSATDLLQKLSNQTYVTAGSAYFKTTITSAFANQDAFDKKYVMDIIQIFCNGAALQL